MWPHIFVQNWILIIFHHWSKSWNWVSEELNPVQVLALVLARIWQWMCPSSSNQLYLWVITYGEWCIWYIWSQETQNNPYIHVVEGRRCVSQGLAMWQVVTCIWLGVTLTEHWSPPLQGHVHVCSNTKTLISQVVLLRLTNELYGCTQRENLV